jgi:hypothetical protein
MRFYKNLHNTDLTPSKQQLLDVALIISILPHIFVVKPVMVLYLFASLVFLIFAKQVKGKHIFLFALLGGLALAFSFYETFTFVGLRKLNVFVSFIISLLFVAVVLQRLTKKINFYILFSPALFLALSYFFYNTIMMLFYAVVAIFSFLLLLLWHRMQSSFMASFKMALSMFVFSIPSIVFLFLVFPRISFETKDFGFSAGESIRTGHDGVMHVGENALLVPSKRVVMEISFDKGVPSPDQLYLRGSVLYIDKTDHWAPLGTELKKLNYPFTDDLLHYRVTLYPHNKEWIYFLDHPVQSPQKTSIDTDHIVRAQKPVQKVMRYDGYSKLNNFIEEEKLSDLKKQNSLSYDPKRDDQLFEYMKSYDKNRGLDGLIDHFKNLKLSYSLKPSGISLSDPVDSFIFGNKEGYCVHFASTFATMARMAGYPSRVVTGFLADTTNSYENYLVVREEDAHAWVEIYIEDKGWQRVETTRYAVGSEDEQQNLSQAKEQTTNPLLHELNLAYMYVRYTIESWVLDYTRSKQMQLLKTLLEDSVAVLKLVSVFVVLFVFAYLLRQLSHSKKDIHIAYEAMKPVLKKLKEHGFEKETHETMEDFLNRVYEKTGEDSLLKLKELYNQTRYANNKELSSELKNVVKLWYNEKHGKV